MRIFVGIKAPPEVTALCLQLQKNLPPEVDLVQAEDFHLTLLPPWEVEENELDEIASKVQNTISSFKHFEVNLEKLEVKMNDEASGFIWVRCTSSSQLTKLKNILGEAFGKKEERDFLPHITLARLLKKNQNTSKGAFIEKELRVSMEVGSVELFESSTQEEIKYSVLEKFVFEEG